MAKFHSRIHLLLFQNRLVQIFYEGPFCWRLFRVLALHYDFHRIKYQTQNRTPLRLNLLYNYGLVVRDP